MIRITPDISLDENELRFEYVRSSGPGGQNVNKVSTAAQMRFDVQVSKSINRYVKDRLIKLAGNKMTSEGILIIQADSYRSQEKNKQDAIQRLSKLIREASKVPRARKKTRPTLASKTKRLDSKKKRGKVKESRRAVFGTSD